tara:strand:- start:593 stop:820 length:228 start_codon:yes stop_codon:yes gene_type:complete
MLGQRAVKFFEGFGKNRKMFDRTYRQLEKRSVEMLNAFRVSCDSRDIGQQRIVRFGNVGPFTLSDIRFDFITIAS